MSPTADYKGVGFFAVSRILLSRQPRLRPPWNAMKCEPGRPGYFWGSMKDFRTILLIYTLRGISQQVTEAQPVGAARPASLEFMRMLDAEMARLQQRT